MFDPIEFTRSLIQFDTTNPPGREAECVAYAAQVLEDGGFVIERQSFGENRMNVVAKLAGTDTDLAPLVFTGHLDTVPLGNAEWAFSPFDGEIVDGRIYGRGSSDMKSGVAAMIGAALHLASITAGKPTRGLTLVLTSGEETGCAGALHLLNEGRNLLGEASAMIVGEPTANKVSTAHKGALFIAAKTKGATAHSSQPELGDNAIYKAAKAISKIEDYGFNQAPHPLLGSPTINVGMVSGGMNVNSVPDQAEFTIDIRTNASRDHMDFFNDLKQYLGDNVELQTFTDMPAISTAITDPFTQLVIEACHAVLSREEPSDPLGLSFFTDASALNTHYQCPTIILGPGEPQAMHQTDEYCHVERIVEAQAIYTQIAERWCA
jgi:succinyl-diaminopimelate desuccinylase